MFLSFPSSADPEVLRKQVAQSLAPAANFETEQYEEARFGWYVKGRNGNWSGTRWEFLTQIVGRSRSWQKRWRGQMLLAVVVQKWQFQDITALGQLWWGSCAGAGLPLGAEGMIVQLFGNWIIWISASWRTWVWRQSPERWRPVSCGKVGCCGPLQP